MLMIGGKSNFLRFVKKTNHYRPWYTQRGAGLKISHPIISLQGLQWPEGLGFTALHLPAHKWKARKVELTAPLKWVFSALVSLLTDIFL